MRSTATDQPPEIINLAEDARALLEATAHLTGQNVLKARKRLAVALKNEEAIADELAEASADMATDVFDALRDRITVVRDQGKELYDHVSDDVMTRAKAADHTVREHPYHAIGIALGVGAVVGFIMSALHTRTNA